jgi:hypothetical protein
MKISFHRFQLKPKRKLNRQSVFGKREGVFLKSEGQQGIGYCEYFPHPELGDESVTLFLETFRDQKNTTQKKALYFLDPKWSRIETEKKFINHQLLRNGDIIESDFVKIKLQDKNDLFFLMSLQGIKKIRLDANGLFDKNNWNEFYHQLLGTHKNLIDYIEDPLSDTSWDSVHLTRARDFIKGAPFEVHIYKPYREFIPDNKKRIIFSGNMGHGLSNYQAYLELISSGNLNEIHGLLTPNLYENSLDIFSGDFRTGFSPNKIFLKNYFHELSIKEWTPLWTF